MKCDKCGLKNDRDAVYCIYCGNYLLNFIKCEKCGNLLNKRQKECPKCKMENPIHEKFHLNAGDLLNWLISFERPRSKTKISPAVIAIIIVIFVIIGMILLFVI